MLFFFFGGRGGGGGGYYVVGDSTRNTCGMDVWPHLCLLIIGPMKIKACICTSLVSLLVRHGNTDESLTLADDPTCRPVITAMTGLETKQQAHADHLKSAARTSPDESPV